MIDARHFVVSPGFVNGHMHISYAHAVRGIFLDDLGSPLPYVFQLQMAMTEDEEYQTTLLGLVELLRNGTVLFVDPGSTKFPDACLQAYEDAGIRVILGECVADQEAPFPLPRHWHPGRHRPHGVLRPEVERAAPRPDPGVGDAVLAGDLQRGAPPRRETRGRRARDRLHAPPRERRRGRAGSPWRGTAFARREYLEANGILGPNVLLSHALGLDDVEVECLARSGAAVTMCPVTAAKGAKGIAEVGRMPELLQRGVRVALGSDSPNNSNHLDMVRTMNMAAIQYKDARQDMRQIPAEQALEMATLLGARAVGLGGRARLDRAGQAGRPRPVRYRSGPSGRPSTIPSTTSSTTRTAAACTR